MYILNAGLVQNLEHINTFLQYCAQMFGEKLETS